MYDPLAFLSSYSIWILFVGFWFGVLGAGIAGEGRRLFGFLLSFILGPIGLIIVAILGLKDPPTKTPKIDATLDTLYRRNTQEIAGRLQPRTRVILKNASRNHEPMAPIPVFESQPCPSCQTPIAMDGLVPGKTYACANCGTPFIPE